ncbi:MAG: hypothetical protein LC802_03040 [Acidobacteria bacterium]|nr:hypothetical protein [Acidobacteriota bacterium]
MSKKRAGADVPAADDAGESPTRAELQRQMEEARDSISETVSEIKTVVSHQYEEVKDTYETVKEGVVEVLDWREQFERNPVVWGAGAVSVGILIGVGLAHVFDDEEGGGGGHGRRKSKEPGTGERLIGELTGLADAVMPTISGKIKEMFGLDLSEYLSATSARRAASAKKSVPRKLAAKKRAAVSARGAKKSGAKKVSAKKPAAKKARAR